MERLGQFGIYRTQNEYFFLRSCTAQMCSYNKNQRLEIMEYKNITGADYLKQKNSMLLQLSIDTNRKYVTKVLKEVAPKSNKTMSRFLELVSQYDQKQLEKEEIGDDAVLLGLERLKVFAEYKFVRGQKGKNRDIGRKMMNYNLSSANFVGNFVLDGLFKKQYIAWETCDDVGYLKSKNILGKDFPEGTYMILLVFPVNADYPYTLIEHIGDKGMKVDHLNPSKYLTERTYNLVKNGVFVGLFDQGQFVAMFNEDGYDIWKTDRIKLDTPQQRFRFVRKYIAGISQNELARNLIRVHKQKSDQKKIAYWETSETDFPPFMRDNQLDYCSDIFAKESKDFLGLELRDNIADDNVTKKDIKLWIQDFIKYDPDDQLINDYPDFLWRVIEYQSTQKKGSKMQSYQDAVRRYEIQERIDQNTMLEPKDITSTLLVEWFQILDSVSERELVSDLQLVYDNDHDRSEVYDLWKSLRVRFPIVKTKYDRDFKNEDWSAVWNYVKEDKGIKPPF